jgi:hypothetical protein
MNNSEDSASPSDASGVSMDPYDPLDKVETSTMKFGRQSGNGDRYYERAAQIDSAADAHKIIGTDGDGYRKVANQDYFYRAMCRSEYDAWQTVFKQGTPELRARKYVELRDLHIEGHHGWASYRQYSADYLGDKHEYTHLLEVHAPGFVSDMRSIGFKSGKAEDGDLSWGMGPASCNAFVVDKNANKVLKKTYEEARTKNLLLLSSDITGQQREMAKSLAPYFFCKAMTSMKTVNIRSTQNKPTAATLKEPKAGEGSNAKKGGGRKRK